MITVMEHGMIHEFRFEGGCRDGAVYRSNSANTNERTEAIRLAQDFGLAQVGVTRPVFTPEVLSLLQSGKQRDLVKIKQHYQMYQVASHVTEHGVSVIRCIQLADDEE